MHITNKRNITQTTYTIHNHNLQTTNTAKYLGIHIHSTLNWNTRINKTAQRAIETSAFLHRNIHTCHTQNQTPSLHNISTSHLRVCQQYLGPTYGPTSTNLRQYNAAQPDTSCTTTIDMSASHATMLQLLHLPTLQQRRQALQNHHAIQNHTPTSHHYSNCHLHHTIHSEYSRLHPALFLPQHHQHMEQRTTCHNQQHSHTTT